MTEKTFHRLHTLAFLGGIALALAVFLACFQLVCIPSESMVPTYQVDDVLIARKTGRAERDQVVLFYRDDADGRSIYIKRCVALAGDTVAVRDGKLIRNGAALDEPYLNEPYIYGAFEEYTVPEGMMFVMGDNRNVSADSRWFGPVPLEDILGRPVLRFSF